MLGCWFDGEYSQPDLMTEFSDSNHWMITLGDRAEDGRPGIRESRERLCRAFLDFRERAGLLAAEISRA
jgi:hypothetical protein